MHKQKKSLMLIILGGGLAVLASYAWGILTIPNASDILWGGVPGGMRSISSIGMLLGALGFFAYTYFILFQLNPAQTRIYGRLGYEVFLILYALILVPSALWLPLTYSAVASSSNLIAWLAKADLIIVGAASICLIFSLLHLEPKQPRSAYVLAVIGSICFTFQTAFMDAIVWGMYFRI